MNVIPSEQRADFVRNGFAVVEQLIDNDVLDELRIAYDDLLDADEPTAGDRMLGGVTRQIMDPSRAHRTFAANGALDAAALIGEQLLGEPVSSVFDMLIFKAPGHPHDTPWHQDMAYAGVPTAPTGSPIPSVTIQFWIAIDDADEENGCMNFVPAKHSKLLEHVVSSGEPDDPGRLLALRDPETQLDLHTAVSAPLAAGGCTVHSYGTPHFTPPNRSTRPRRAYIVNFATVAFANEVARRHAARSM